MASAASAEAARSRAGLRQRTARACAAPSFALRPPAHQLRAYVLVGARIAAFAARGLANRGQLHSSWPRREKQTQIERAGTMAKHVFACQPRHVEDSPSVIHALLRSCADGRRRHVAHLGRQQARFSRSRPSTCPNTFNSRTTPAGRRLGPNCTARGGLHQLVDNMRRN